MKMTYEYMSELHRVLHFSDDSDTDTLTQKVHEHLKYIPH